MIHQTRSEFEFTVVTSSPQVIYAISLVWQNASKQRLVRIHELSMVGESLRQKPHRTPLRKKASMRWRSAEFVKPHAPGTGSVCQLGDDDCLVVTMLSAASHIPWARMIHNECRIIRHVVGH